MPRSDRSDSSRRSSRSTGSRATTVATKTTEVPLPKKSMKMDFLLYFAGARPGNMMHLRRDEITEEFDYDVEYSKHGKGRDSSYRTTRTQWHFVATPWDAGYYDYVDDESTVSRSKSRKSSSRSSSSRRHRRKGGSGDAWNKPRSRHDEDAYSEDSSDSDPESDGEYGPIPPHPPHGPFQHHPPQGFPPMGHPHPGGPPPPPPQDDMPAFFTINQNN